MTIKTLVVTIAVGITLSTVSCSIFKSTKKTTVTKTENKVEKLPSGTVETSTVSTTQTITEKNPKAIEQASTPTSATNEPPVFTFGQVTEDVPKGDHVIHDTMTTTNNKTPAKISQKVFTEDSVVRDGDYDCHVRIVEINAKSSTFMNADYEAQGQHIYPGAIYNYNDFKTGNYKEITSDRNPIKLLTDVPNITGSTWNVIDNPDVS
ncbi:MAG: hypothetical protein ACTHK0_13265 [Ginsengibacter sp.]